MRIAKFLQNANSFEVLSYLAKKGQYLASPETSGMLWHYS